MGLLESLQSKSPTASRLQRSAFVPCPPISVLNLLHSQLMERTSNSSGTGELPRQPGPCGCWSVDGSIVCLHRWPLFVRGERHSSVWIALRRGKPALDFGLIAAPSTIHAGILRLFLRCEETAVDRRTRDCHQRRTSSNVSLWLFAIDGTVGGIGPDHQYVPRPPSS